MQATVSSISQAEEDQQRRFSTLLSPLATRDSAGSHPVRLHINVAFAIAEVVWTMTGRNDLAFLEAWNSRLPEYVGKGSKLHGAYGYRLRHKGGVDQLTRAYQSLHNNPNTRQVVLQIWDSIS